VVNVSSRFEALADEGEVCFSEDTYNALADKTEIPCVFYKEVPIKGKKGLFKLYKAANQKEDAAFPVLEIKGPTESDCVSDTESIHRSPLYKLVCLSPDGNIDEYEIPLDGLVIGRGQESSVRLPDKLVSLCHAMVFYGKDGLLIQDMGSKNGTTVNGSNIEKNIVSGLSKKQHIKIGPYVFVVADTGEKVTPSFFSETKSSIFRRIKEILRPD
jgi:hypothetical protein